MLAFPNPRLRTKPSIVKAPIFVGYTKQKKEAELKEIHF